MRKMISLLVVLVVCGPVLGGTVSLTVNQDVSTLPILVGELHYTADANVSGFGLKITVDSGAVITVVGPNHVGDCDASNRGFGIFPESFSTYLDAGSPDWGDPNYTPVAPNDAPGAAGTGIGYDSVILEMGALYEDGNAPAKSGVLCGFIVSADCNVSVTGDASRGNVVLEDTTEATLNLTSATGVRIEDACWYPPCWDCPKQCYGDSDCNGIVDTYDWTIFRNGFVGAQGIASPSYITNACADTDRDGDVDTFDWTVFRNTFMAPGGTPPLPDCPPGDINGIFCPL